LFRDDEIPVALEVFDATATATDTYEGVAAESDGTLVGWASWGPVPCTLGTFDLYWIVVDPQYQSQRVGTKLMDFFEDTLRGMNGRMILIDTSSISPYETVHRFYSEKGYREVARVPDYYWPGNDRITFCKKLRDETDL
jgi:GNAT superfamily N-acetyltransferase